MAQNDNTISPELTAMYCGHCCEIASSRCRACGNMWYCSVECQQADWQFHKLLCKQLIDFQTRPTENHRRTILLPQDSAKPVFSWTPIEIMKDALDSEDLNTAINGEGTIVSEQPTTNQTFGTYDDVRQPLITGQLSDGVYLEHTINVMFCADSDNLPRNKCARMVFYDSITSRFRGPITFSCSRGGRIIDIDSKDFTLAMDALLAAERKIVGYSPIPKKRTGVKVSKTEPHYQDVKVPLRHPIFVKGTVSKLSRLLKADIRTLKYSTNASTPSPPPAAEGPLNAAAYLHPNLDVNSPAFGTIPDKLKNDSASVLVVGEGPTLGVPAAHTLETLIGFIKENIFDAIFADVSLSPQQKYAAIGLRTNIAMYSYLQHFRNKAAGSAQDQV